VINDQKIERLHFTYADEFFEDNSSTYEWLTPPYQKRLRMDQLLISTFFIMNLNLGQPTYFDLYFIVRLPFLKFLYIHLQKSKTRILSSANPYISLHFL